MSENVFVLGLDDHNHQVLQRLPDAERYRFHSLLTIPELQYGKTIPLRELLEKAQTQLERINVAVDSIIGFWDFPVTTMVPILCRRVGGLPSASLNAIVKCEHKYWSRLEQQKVIDEYPRFGLVDLERDTEPPEGVNYPMWVKPVKSFSSDLAYSVSDIEEFRDALDQIRQGIGRIGEPFDILLEHLDLPPEIAAAGGMACLAEEAISGRQLTVEGYRYRGRAHILGVVDSITHDQSSSFVRFQYPAAVPDRVNDRMADITTRILDQIELDDTTFNIEFFWDEETDDLNVLEVNPRHSQSHAELFEQVDGVSNHQAMVRMALGSDPGMSHRDGPYPIAAKWFLRHWHDGVSRRHPSDEEITALEHELPGVTVDVIAHQGDRLSELFDQDSYSYKIANIYIGANDEDELRAKFERCADVLPFEFDE
ncbi:ATP-grasp domain-containing protein [Sciscionella marina]|uniref:ATP-grasp domain-containing protein n=1 Tax=Sciscionella marina TaxID=508770 RepID=UPI0003692DA5|nr:ATP-grasp domain-containing protein [Sciscionella marina]